MEKHQRQGTLRFGPPRKRKVLWRSVFSTDSGLLKRSLALKQAFFAPKLVASKKVPRKLLQRQQFPPQIERCKIFAKARGAKRGRPPPSGLRRPERQTRGPGSRAPEGQRAGGGGGYEVGPPQKRKVVCSPTFSAHFEARCLSGTVFATFNLRWELLLFVQHF